MNLYLGVLKEEGDLGRERDSLSNEEKTSGGKGRNNAKPAHQELRKQILRKRRLLFKLEGSAWSIELGTRRGRGAEALERIKARQP